ncbi:MAG: hypothetical protein ABI382_08965 [Nakamurella sp.]
MTPDVNKTLKSTPPSPSNGWQVTDSTVLDLLAGWLPNQRWFAGGAAEASRVTLTRRVRLTSTDSVAAEVVLIDSGDVARRGAYQVVLGWRSDMPQHLGHAVIGSASDLTCYDGLLDDDITAPLLDAIATGSSIGPITTASADLDILATADRHGLTMTAEQSNTSIIFGNALIMKFFRRVEPGINPDAEVSAKLSGRTYSADYGGELRIDIDAVPTTLALVTRFIPNSADAWSTATASMRDLLAEGDLHADEVGGDFASEAFRLGGVIARMHLDLAEIFGQHPLPHAEIDSVLSDIERDATALADRIPDMALLLPAIRSTCAVLAHDLSAATPLGQRIHGDLHLGQVLRTVDGWVVIDFEGEPAISMGARRLSKPPVKDIAGMLRSFDYAARHTLYVSTVNAQRVYRSDEWLAHNRAAFLDGYSADYGSDPRETPALLTVFELAKAIYEVDYEQRHRPNWVKIPLDAVRALTTPQ